MPTELLIWGGAFILLCAGFGTFFAFRNMLPDVLSWVTFTLAPLVVKAILGYMMKRMTPEEEADWHQAIAEGRSAQWGGARMRKKLKPWFSKREPPTK